MYEDGFVVLNDVVDLAHLAMLRERMLEDLPKILAREEVDRLIAAAGAKDGAQGLRLGCMVELLYASGLRISELIALPASPGASAPGVFRIERERPVDFHPVAIVQHIVSGHAAGENAQA